MPLQTTDFPYSMVGRVPFAATDLQQAATWLIDLAKDTPAPVAVRLANAYCVALADVPGSYQDLMVSDGVNLPDGFPVVRVMQYKMKGAAKRPGRVRGPSFFNLVLDQGRSSQLRHFFLGGSPDTLSRLQISINSRYPSIQIVGAYSPPFAPVSEEYLNLCFEAIEGSSAEVIWVGLGTPKQDFVASELAKRLQRPVIGIGAAFDFAAGTTREAPSWVQGTGTEWLFRLATEPRRLGRRYTLGNLAFLRAAFRTINTTD